AAGGMLFAFSKEWWAYGGDPDVAPGGKGKKASPEDYKGPNPVRQAYARGKKVLKGIDGAKAEFERVKAEAEKERLETLSIVAGQKEQRNWLELMKFLDEAIPRPDDVATPEGLKRLPPTAKDYVRGAQAALIKWQGWRASKSTGGDAI